MTSKSLLALLALASVVVAAGYFHFQPDVTEAPTADISNTQSARPDPKSDAVLQLPLQESVTTETDSDESDPPKEYATTLTGERVEVETVFGFKVRKDRNCTFHIQSYTTHEDGTVSPTLNCVPNEPEPVDIYRSYSNAELETLAYSDSRAAYNMTLRLRDREYSKAVDYALRSAALDGDIKGIAVMTVYIPHSAKDGDKWNLEYIKEQYVLSGIAQAVDRSSTLHNGVSRHARLYQGNGIDIEALDARIADHLRTIQNIRNEVGID